MHDLTSIPVRVTSALLTAIRLAARQLIISVPLHLWLVSQRRTYVRTAGLALVAVASCGGRQTATGCWQRPLTAVRE